MAYKELCIPKTSINLPKIAGKVSHFPAGRMTSWNYHPLHLRSRREWRDWDMFEDSLNHNLWRLVGRPWEIQNPHHDQNWPGSPVVELNISALIRRCPCRTVWPEIATCSYTFIHSKLHTSKWFVFVIVDVFSLSHWVGGHLATWLNWNVVNGIGEAAMAAARGKDLCAQRLAWQMFQYRRRVGEEPWRQDGLKTWTKNNGSTILQKQPLSTGQSRFLAICPDSLLQYMMWKKQVSYNPLNYSCWVFWFSIFSWDYSQVVYIPYQRLLPFAFVTSPLNPWKQDLQLF